MKIHLLHPCLSPVETIRAALQGQALLPLVAMLALALFSGPEARAQSTNFAYTGFVVTYTIPTTGTYQLIATGAQGGAGGSGAFSGGYGVSMT
ncbi:MAG: hypothetical protein ACOYOI_02890, partial [Chthoniobacterales bacterium]